LTSYGEEQDYEYASVSQAQKVVFPDSKLSALHDFCDCLLSNTCLHVYIRL